MHRGLRHDGAVSERRLDLLAVVVRVELDGLHSTIAEHRAEKATIRPKLVREQKPAIDGDRRDRLVGGVRVVDRARLAGCRRLCLACSEAAKRIALHERLRSKAIRCLPDAAIGIESRDRRLRLALRRRRRRHDERIAIDVLRIRARDRRANTRRRRGSSDGLWQRRAARSAGPVGRLDGTTARSDDLRDRCSTRQRERLLRALLGELVALAIRANSSTCGKRRRRRLARRVGHARRAAPLAVGRIVRLVRACLLRARRRNRLEQLRRDLVVHHARDEVCRTTASLMLTHRRRRRQPVVRSQRTRRDRRALPARRSHERVDPHRLASLRGGIDLERHRGVLLQIDGARR